MVVDEFEGPFPTSRRELAAEGADELGAQAQPLMAGMLSAAQRSRNSEKLTGELRVAVADAGAPANLVVDGSQRIACIALRSRAIALGQTCRRTAPASSSGEVHGRTVRSHFRPDEGVAGRLARHQGLRSGRDLFLSELGPPAARAAPGRPRHGGLSKASTPSARGDGRRVDAEQSGDAAYRRPTRTPHRRTAAGRSSSRLEHDRGAQLSRIRSAWAAACPSPGVATAVGRAVGRSVARGRAHSRGTGRLTSKRAPWNCCCRRRRRGSAGSWLADSSCGPRYATITRCSRRRTPGCRRFCRRRRCRHWRAGRRCRRGWRGPRHRRGSRGR